MYAVIRTGGKQYRVEKDAVLKLEKLGGAVGDSVSFEEVLLLGDGERTEVGAPHVEGARVTAEVLEQTRGPKIVVFKKQRRKNHRRTQGHRQDLTVVRVTEIEAKAGAKAAAKPKSKAKAKPKAEAKPKAKAAPKAEAKTDESPAPEAAGKSEE